MLWRKSTAAVDDIRFLRAERKSTATVDDIRLPYVSLK